MKCIQLYSPIVIASTPLLKRIKRSQLRVELVKVQIYTSIEEIEKDSPKCSPN
jgi:hypothetical protein